MMVVVAVVGRLRGGCDGCGVRFCEVNPNTHFRTVDGAATPPQGHNENNTCGLSFFAR